MGFRIGGVRLWLGHAHEGAADEAGDWYPLREIVSLCGLTLGPEHAPQDRPVRLDRIRQIRQGREGIRLATRDGQAVNVGDQPISRVSSAEDFDDQRETGG